MTRSRAFLAGASFLAVALCVPSSPALGECGLSSYRFREAVPKGAPIPPNERYGSALAAADVDGDGYQDIVVGAPRGSHRRPDGQIEPCPLPPADKGRVFVYSGRTVGLIGILEGASCEDFGASLARLGDVNEDGRHEIIVGAPGAQGNRGRVSVYSFREGRWDEVLTLPGQSPNGRFGSAVAALPGLGAQGGDAVAVSAPLDGPGGKIYVFEGDSGLLFEKAGVVPGEGFGAALGSAGDFNGDGIGDLVVGSVNLANSGRVHVFSGAGPGHEILFVRNGFAPGDGFGGSVVAFGDVNKDTYDEIAVGAPLANSGGSVYLFLGGAKLVGDGGIRGKLDTTWSGEQPGDGFGSSVVGLGELTGASGLAVAAPAADDGAVLATGRVYVYPGTQIFPRYVLSGPFAGARLGRALTSVGDPDGDGISDLVASQEIPTPDAKQGEVLLYLLGDEDGNGLRDACQKCPRTDDLQLDTPAEFTLLRYALRRCFELNVAPGRTVRLSLAATDPADALVLYAKWGGEASPLSFDLAADRRFEASQELIVPATRGATLHILVQANNLDGGTSEVTLLATEIALTVESTAITRLGLGGDGMVSTLIRGAGFRQGLEFSLVGAVDSGRRFEASAVRILSPEEALVNFDLSERSEADAGPYHLEASLGDLSARLDLAFEIRPEDLGEALGVSLETADYYRFNSLERLLLTLKNTGDRLLPPPIIKIAGPPNTLFFLRQETFAYEGEVYVLGHDPGVENGALPPGAELEIPIFFRSRYYQEDCPPEGCPADFESRFLQPLALPLVLETMDPPRGMTAAEWASVREELQTILGGTWRTYNEALGRLGARLARRRDYAISLRQVFRFAVRQAYGRPSAAITGKVLDAESEAPLKDATVVALENAEVKSFAATDKTGFFSLDWLEPGTTYRLEVVSKDVGDVELTLPVDAAQPGGGGVEPTVLDGDLHGVRLLATDAPENDWPLTCANCDLSGLPDEPLSPPAAILPVFATERVTVVGSWDPNVKEGSGGQGSDDLLRSGEVITYTVHFENKGPEDTTATAAPRKITITDELDPLLDWTTVELQDVYVSPMGDSVVSLDLEAGDESERYEISVDSVPLTLDFTTPGGESIYWDDIELTVRAEVARADETTGTGEEHGVITWELEMDPLPLDDPDRNRKGLLPWGCESDDATEDGEITTNLCSGYVTFTVLPFALSEEAAIPNEASIQFDSNPPISTSEEEGILTLTYVPELFVEAPRNPWPSDGTESDAGDTRLQWQGENASEYEVYLWPASLGAVRPSETDTLVWETDVPINAYPLGDDALVLDEGVTYNWQVVARNETETEESGIWKFTTTGERPFKRGDVNQSGALDVSDPIYLLLHLFAGGSAPLCAEAADANDSGFLDVSDASYLLSYLFVAGSAPEDPFQACGPDPSPDDLGCESFGGCE